MKVRKKIKKVILNLDLDTFEALRDIQGRFIQITKEHWSFTKTVTGVILFGLEHLKEIDEEKVAHIKEMIER